MPQGHQANVVPNVLGEYTVRALSRPEWTTELHSNQQTLHSDIVRDIIAGIEAVGGDVVRDPNTDYEHLKEKDYSEAEIATKTQLSKKYVHGVIKLLGSHEHRLLRAVESGKIPVSVAVDIADADDVGVQRVLRQAYEKKLLRGGRLLSAKRLVEARQKHGKGRAPTGERPRKSLSVESLLKTYENDVEKKKVLLRKASATRSELLFLAQALKTLMADENFVTLLRAEGLTNLPKQVADRLTAHVGWQK
ncbi:partitioning protein [Rhodobacteraceae bacterium KLH11]|nr:partitioning protein [Rhodobacteraceae bacterium KLH11]